MLSLMVGVACGLAAVKIYKMWQEHRKDYPVLFSGETVERVELPPGSGSSTEVFLKAMDKAFTQVCRRRGWDKL